MNKHGRHGYHVYEYMRFEAWDERIDDMTYVKDVQMRGHDVEVWDVRTDKESWWVILGPTNLYSQQVYPDVDAAVDLHRWLFEEHDLSIYRRR